MNETEVGSVFPSDGGYRSTIGLSKTLTHRVQDYSKVHDKGYRQSPITFTKNAIV